MGALGRLDCPKRPSGPSRQPAVQRVISVGKTHVDQPEGRKKKDAHTSCSENDVVWRKVSHRQSSAKWQSAPLSPSLPSSGMLPSLSPSWTLVKRFKKASEDVLMKLLISLRDGASACSAHITIGAKVR